MCVGFNPDYDANHSQDEPQREARILPRKERDNTRICEISIA